MDGHAVRRLVWATVLAAALVVGAVALPSYAKGHRQGTLQSKMDARKQRSLEARPHVDPPGTPPHNHNDPKTKNAVSRAGETGKDVRDPSTFLTRARAGSAVAAQRKMQEPTLSHVRVMQKRLEHPQDRYAMANGCYRLGGQEIYFKPTDLGQYLLYTTDRQFLVNGGKRGGAERRDDLDGPAAGARLHVHQRRPAARARRQRHLPAHEDHGLRRLPGGGRRRLGQAARRRDVVPGGAGVRRRAHPRHGLRVPRRRRALRQAVGPVRCAVRPGRLPRPHRHRRVRRRARGRAVRRSRTTTRSAGRRSRTGRRPTR